MASGARFSLEFGKSAPSQRRDEEKPLRVLLLGDLRGDTKEPTPIEKRRMMKLDIDTFEEVMERLAPSVLLPHGDEPATNISFSELEDFHPDELVEKVALFAKLKDLRGRLNQPKTFAKAAAELKGTEPRAESKKETQDVSTFDQLLGLDGPRQEAPKQKAASGIEGLIRDVVSPYVVAEPDPQLPQFLSAVDTAMSDVMRALLHDFRFQRLEATWLGLQSLVSVGEEALSLDVFQVTKEEIRAHLSTDLQKRVIEKELQTAGGRQWDLLVGSFTIDGTPEDLDLLEALGRFAKQADVPFLATAHHRLLCSSLADDHKTWAIDDELQARWRTIRTSDYASHLALALPRVLLRLPYGKKSDPIERFTFEELKDDQDHEAYLWGSAAFATAMVIARGLQGQPNPHELDDLPAYVFSDDGESVMKPCAEVCLTEAAADAILKHGLIPIVSYKNRNAALLIRLQSIADPPTTIGAR